jgi:hypothetical protein
MAAGALARAIAALAHTMAESAIGSDCFGPRMITPSDELEDLRAELASVSDLLVLTNDAALGLSGIIGA